jgi:UDP-N-acetyl-alpha-D-muramoyl-L-alanyl-L-glutamate epimerase
MNYLKIRQKHNRFIYESYSYNHTDNNLNINYYFKIEPDILFQPFISIKGISRDLFKSIDRQAMENFIFNIGIMEIPSYWKTTIAPQITIKAGSLSADQINWWHDLFIKGMGQFYYENNIDFTKDNFLKINSESKTKGVSNVAKIDGNKVLIPFGGGKDSAVTLEIIRKKSIYTPGLFIMHPSTPAALEIGKRSGLNQIIEVERRIDPKLISLNSQGFLNGHTPYSAMLAFISVFAAFLFDYKHIAFSNENSSNEGNVLYFGHEVNHQYSKTLEFENKFREYNKKYLSDINYFSFLRPLYELQIARIFSKTEKYFPLIRSCNTEQKTGKWCSHCPKCLSTFILLYPFLGNEKILSIFPENMYDNKDLFELLETLVSKDKIKPLECVGTKEEIKIALFLATRYFKEDKDMPILLKIAKEKLLKGETDLIERARNVLTSWEENNNLDNYFEEILKKQL